MWIYTDGGSLINTARVEEISYCHTSYDSYEVVVGVRILVHDAPKHAAQEIVEKIAWCIVHGVDMVRLTRDGDVLDMMSYSNHGTARYTQRVYLKS